MYLNQEVDRMPNVDSHPATTVAGKSELKLALRHAIEDRGPDPQGASVEEQMQFLATAEEAFRETMVNLRSEVSRMPREIHVVG